MKIYLAGKIAQNDWRHEVVPGLRGSGDLVDPGEPVPPWSSLPTVIDGVDCVGPFFATSCDHGCMHGPGTHGQGRDGRYEGDAYRSLTRSQVHQRCLDAIKACDVFFAWLPMVDPPAQPTAYGTLVELGYARALDKVIIIGTDSPDHADQGRGGRYDCLGGHGCACGTDDLWFAYESAKAVMDGRTPLEAFRRLEHFFRRLMIGEQRSKLESPLEHAFFDAYLSEMPAHLDGMIAQHSVTAGGHNYRLDFAIPDRKIAFEMDGKTYHGTDKAFVGDRRRDLNLELAGWRVHRFDGDLIRHDPANAVRIAATLAGGPV